MKNSFEFEVKEFTSKSGKVYKIDADRLVSGFKEDIAAALEKVKADVKADNEEFEWNQPCDLATEEGRSRYFHENFYIHYQGSPSLNGGKFHYGKGSRDSHKKPHDGYKKLIEQTLSCDKDHRMFGYGRNQLGMKYVEENVDTSAKFIEFLLANKIVDLNSYVMDYSEKKPTRLMKYGEALYWYCVRSNNKDLATKFIGFTMPR